VELLSDPTARNVGPRTDTILTELILLTNQASQLMERIPPDFLSAIEYYSLAPAFINAANPEQADSMYLKAIEAARTRREKVIAFRGYAVFLMRHQQPQKGREFFAEAISANEVSSSKYPEVALRDDILTYLNWSSYEVVQRQCADARAALDKAAALLTQLLLPSTDVLTVQLKAISKSVDACT